MTDSEVKIVYAFADFNEMGGITWSNTSVYILVKNKGIDTVSLRFMDSKNKTNDCLCEKVDNDNGMNLFKGIVTFNSMLSCVPQDVIVTAIAGDHKDENVLIRHKMGPQLFIKDSFNFLMLTKSDNKVNMQLTYVAPICDDEKKTYLIYCIDDKWDDKCIEELQRQTKVNISADNENSDNLIDCKNIVYSYFETQVNTGGGEDLQVSYYIRTCCKDCDPLSDCDQCIYDSNRFNENQNYHKKLQTSNSGFLGMLDMLNSGLMSGADDGEEDLSKLTSSFKDMMKNNMDPEMKSQMPDLDKMFDTLSTLLGGMGDEDETSDSVPTVTESDLRKLLDSDSESESDSNME